MAPEPLARSAPIISLFPLFDSATDIPNRSPFENVRVDFFDKYFVVNQKLLKLIGLDELRGKPGNDLVTK